MRRAPILSPARSAALGLAAVSGAFVAQSAVLDRWGLFGPGEGLFPLAITALCCSLSLLLVAVPGLGGQAPEDDVPEADLAPSERRSFAACVLALLAISAGPLLKTGFAAIALAVAAIMTWQGEGRSFVRALAFGMAAAGIGIVLFGAVLGVAIPESPLELRLMSLVR